jgi:putative phosphoribosyl transferase
VLEGREAVVVDDGVATGGTALASIRWAWDRGADTVVFAAPVGPASAFDRLSPVCTQVVIPLVPSSFSSVGDWYRIFAQVSDDEVRAALGAGV